MTDKPNNKAGSKWQPGNQGALKHGGAAALDAIQNNREFTGLAKAAQDQVQSRLDLTGIEGELLRDAIRLQVVSDLYYSAFIKAIESGDLDKAGAVLKIFGWNHNSAIRAWDLVRRLKQPDGMTEANAVIEQYRQELDQVNNQGGDNAPGN